MIQQKPNKKLVKTLLRRQRKARCWLNKKEFKFPESDSIVKLKLNSRKKRKQLYEYYGRATSTNLAY